jgi:multidrug efflux pump subunit AcrB
MSFNIMTLGGMAAAAGLNIDDAIVMTEHIMRRLHGSKEPARELAFAIGQGSEMQQPLAIAIISGLLVQLPLVLLLCPCCIT